MKTEREMNRMEKVRDGFEESQLKAVKKILTKKRIAAICEEKGYKYREREITPLITILHMIGAAISRERSFQSAWSNCGLTGKSDTLSKARKRLPKEIWQGLDVWIEGKIEEEFGEEGYWKGHRVIGIDGTCVSMSDEEELQKEFGKSDSKHGKSRFPIARMVFGFILNTQVTVSHKIGGYKISEKELFRKMMKENLKARDLVICDRHFAGANLYVEYKEAGLEFITRKHQMLQIDRLKKVKENGKRDFVVEMPLNKKHIKENPGWPQKVMIRLINANVRGENKTFWLATSLLDDKKYPAKAVRQLYKRRWEVETLIEEQKIWFGSDVLRSKTAPGIKKELYARIIAGNLVHWLILKAAQKHKQNPQRISRLTATRLISCYSFKMSEASERKQGLLYEKLLDKIASAVIPYRPNRREPRLKKRDQKHYSILRTTRAQWRKDNENA